MYFNELVICSFVSDIHTLVHFGQHIFKISSNFSLWLGFKWSLFYFSKCPPPAAIHFTALSLMSSIALLIMAGSICTTSLMMLACSSLRVAGRGLENGRRWKSMSSLWPKELFIFMEGHSKVTPKSRQQSVSTHYQDCFLHLDSLQCNALPHKDLSKIPYGFLTNQSYICHSWFWLNSLFFETPCSSYRGISVNLYMLIIINIPYWKVDKNTT